MSNKIILKKSSVSDKIPLPGDLEYGELALNYNDGKLYYKNSSNIVAAISGDSKESNEPMGFVDRLESAISFNNVTRVLSISPVGASFSVYCKGQKYIFTNTKTVQIPNATGLYYVYFDPVGNIYAKTTFFDWENDAMVAYVYWNATISEAIYISDERHGFTLDWATHEYLHRTRGAVLANGFSAANYTTTGDGSLNTDAQIDIGNGTFFDEDLQIDIIHSNTPTANTWEQILQGPARIPVFYMLGDSVWYKTTPTTVPLKLGTTLAQYNYFNTTSGLWELVECNKKYTGVCIIATNNLTYPVIAIMGQANENQLDDILAFSFYDLQLPHFPSVEYRPLYKVVYEVNTGYSNSSKAKIVSVIDERFTSSIGGGGSGAGGGGSSDHGLLIGLSDDDHPQYVHNDIARTITADHTFTGSLSITGSLNIDESDLVISNKPSGLSKVFMMMGA